MISLGDRKSLDLLCELWVNLAKNQRYQKFVGPLDLKEFHKRTDNEGLHFLTTSLPSLGKALDFFHATTAWKCPADFASGQDGIPYFLGDAVRKSMEGDSEAVDCIRQLCLMFYKLEVDYDQTRKDEFLENFKKVDQDLALVDLPDNDPVINRARWYIGRILCNEDPLDIRPCHGSGSTACRTPNYEKWSKLRYFPRLDSVFSYPDYFFYSYTHFLDEIEKLVGAVESDPVARIVLVPKDSRGPRVISCEPAELMFIQQGLMRKLYSILETHKSTRGQLNFADQGVNRNLAYQSSMTGEKATLDLSDASDRVSFKLVERLFPQNWFEALSACRSESTMLPNGEIMRFNKFAPMGSSCCFPVEALVFWAIAKAAIYVQTFGPLSPQYGDRKVARMSVDPGILPDVHVYGDDIIVDAEQAATVVLGLESVGLVVNRHKSYVKGPFRESCGGAYHNGYDVTPVQVRSIPHASRNSLATDIDFCNNLIAKFGDKEASTTISIVEMLYQEPFARSLMQLPCCVRSESSASNDVFFQRRWHFGRQRYEHRIPQPYTPTKVRCEAAWSELLRKELTRESRSSQADPDRYQHRLSKANAHADPGVYAEGHSAQLKWQWTWLG